MSLRTTTTLQPTLAVREDGLVPITVATLSATENLDFELYLPADPGGRPRLYRGGNYPLRQHDIDQLLEQGVRILYVPSTEHDRYKHHLQENLDSSLNNEQLPPVQRYQMLQAAGRDLLAESFQQKDAVHAVSGASDVGQRMTRLLSGRDVMLSGLFRVMSHDFDTFSHVINVATYCLVLAERLGIQEQVDLDRIAVGALLHDLGKLDIPPAILNKPGSLTPSEWEIVRQHPQTGFEQLCFSEELTEGQLMMVYQHHERLNGQGYPVGVWENDIHRWAQLCAVADVFEATIAKRPYRWAMSVLDALEHLDKQAGIGLNREMVQCLKATIRAKP